MPTFQNMTLKAKGGSLQLVLALSMLLVVIFAQRAIGTLSDKVSAMAGQSLPQLERIAQIERSLARAQFEFTRSVAWANTGVPSDVLTAQVTRAGEARAEIEALLDTHLNGGTVPIIRDMPDLVASYIESHADALSTLEIDTFTGTMLANETDSLHDDMIDRATDVSEAELTAINMAAGAALSDAGQEQTRFWMIAGILTVISMGLLTMILKSVVNAIKTVTATMHELANDNLDVAVDGAELKNEIGEMSAALLVFRDTAVESKALRAAEEKARADAAEAEREAQAQNEAEAQATALRDRKEREAAEHRAEQSQRLETALGKAVSRAKMGDFSQKISDAFEEGSMVDTRDGVNDLLASVHSSITIASQTLEDLANGNLRARMTGEFHGVFAQLQHSTNVTAGRFEETVRDVLDSAHETLGSAEELSAAATELARRTESTAANLEETSAAVTELSASVGSVVENAERVDSILSKTKNTANDSQVITQSAGETMDKIAENAAKIEKFVSVINDISFQTNLLALNAGVEAARAGESGRGFSVVASEVRNLAQNAAASAKQIEALITESSANVREGVDMVSQMRALLAEIGTDVSNVASNATDIAAGIREQASSLTEVGAAITQIDTITQQNAAMFEETTASTKVLTGEVERLTSMAGKFDIQSEGADDNWDRPALSA